MKSEIRMALLAMATVSAAPAFAQDTPQCAAYFDNAQQFFTSRGAPDGALNRQCFLTVMPKDGPQSLANFPQLSQYPGPVLTEGTYEITLAGGGGGGGGAGLIASGGGGAGAVPYKTTQYLAPGVYKLTIGTGGRGGIPGFVVGGSGEAGAPTAMTMAYTNETVAGFRGADTWAGRTDRNSYMVASSRNVAVTRSDGIIADGQGADGPAPNMGGGGDGGIKPDRNRAERPAQNGEPMIVAGIPTGRPGAGGMRDGGGGGGASYGDGGNGKSDDQSGAKGGDGFVKLVPIQLAQATPARPAPMAAPVVVQPAPYVAPAAAKRDRN